MKKTVVAAFVAMFVAAPAVADTLNIMLPSLTWPDGTVVVSTMGSDDAAATSCTPAN